MLEGLEHRRLLAATLNAATGELLVTGTAGNDTLRLAASGANVVVSDNNRAATFPLAQVKRVRVNGLDGNDTISLLTFAANQTALNVRAHLDGGNGGDTLTGGLAFDTLVGGAGNDSLNGNAGDDSLDGGLGADTITGGAGADTASYAARTAPVTVTLDDDLANDGQANEKDHVKLDVENLLGGAGRDRLTGNALDNTIDGGGEGDVISGRGGDDLILGGAGSGNDSLFGKEGDDTLRGGSGNDGLYAGDGHDSLDAGLGNDSAYGEAGDDTLAGDDGRDLLAGGDGDDRVDGGLGDDRALGEAGDDTVSGGATGNDTLAGGDGADTADYADHDNARPLPGRTLRITLDADANDGFHDAAGNQLESDFVGEDFEAVNGSAGDDHILMVSAAVPVRVDGRGGNDSIVGSLLADTLLGGAGNDTLRGGAGDNVFRGGDGADLMQGNNGNELFADLVAGPTVPPPSGDQDDGSYVTGDTVDAGSGNDTIVGSDAGDELRGDDGDDVISAAAGRDLVDGGDGFDTLDGGTDNDTVVGGFNDDSIVGGDGNDVLGNADGEADTVVGGDGLDAAQEEAALNDTFPLDDVETFYDLNDDPTLPALTPAPALPAVPLPNSVIVLPPVANAAPVGAPSVTRAGSSVTLHGTDGDDRDAVVETTGGKIRVRIASPTDDYPVVSRELAAGVFVVHVFAHDGDDRIDLSDNRQATGSVVDAGLGDDTIIGGRGPDDIDGGPGPRDGQSDRDLITGGTGSSPGVEGDAVRYTKRRAGVRVTLPSTRADATANDGAPGEGDTVGFDIEHVYGGRGSDTLVGSNRADMLAGGLGADTINGGRGADLIFGNKTDSGIDTLRGGAGRDAIFSNNDNFQDFYDKDGTESPKFDAGLDELIQD